MPRSSATARKNHSNRNENGVVGLGRKVTKQKSNGLLNGISNSHNNNNNNDDVDSASASGYSPQVNVSSSVSRSPADPAVTPIVPSTTTTSPSTTTSEVNGAAVAAAPTNGSKSVGNARGYVNGYDKGIADHNMLHGQSNGALLQSGGFLSGLLEKSPATSPSSSSSNRKSTSNTSINPFQLASTILKSCPMYDTIAILIFLLQLPPMVLTCVQFLFASLTFMPPSGASSGTLTSNFDIFQGPAGTPSLGTMIAMDIFCLLFWGLFMWTWAQNFALDLAHVQVAITLGGGGSGKNGGVNTLCVAIVLIIHLVRSKDIQDFVLSRLLSAKFVNPDLLSQYSHLIPSELRSSDSQSSPSWIRSLLAVHILAQAATAMARRAMAKNRMPAPRTGKRVDTEASAGSQTQMDSAFESGASVSSVVGADGQIMAPSALKDGKDRFVSAKKRRRQAHQVRSRQPFWAELASIKVTVMREYEHSRALSKTARGLSMTEDDLQGVTLDDGLVWITNVDGCSIKFAAADFGATEDPTASGACEAGHLGGEDMEPFYVCVNGALWATVTISKVQDAPKGSNAVQWRGEISGLAPNCAYTCSFLRSDTDDEICVMSVKTPPTTDADQVAVSSSVTAPSQPSYRPSSPTTTLRNSIATAEAKLNEKRSRMKKSKNDHKLAISKTRKELENYNHRLRSGTDENRQKQRSLQLERNIKQTAEMTSELERQLRNLENIPDNELEEWSTEKAKFEAELERFNSAKEEFAAAKSAVARVTASLESELNSTVQRRERLQGRRTRLTEQHERILYANAQGLNERERRAAEQFAREQDHAKLEASFNEQFASFGQSIQEYQLRSSQLWQQASAIEQAIRQHQQQHVFMEAGPLTPEGNLPGTTNLSENNGMPLTSLPTTTSNHRSLLGMSFPSLKTSPRQSASSPVGAASSSHPASPVQQSSYLQRVSSPLANPGQLFNSESSRRNRSFSNRSARSGQFGSDLAADTSRLPPLQVDLSELIADKRRSSGSDGNGPTNLGFRPISSPFKHTESNGSGSGSGSGSPCSAHGKGNNNMN